jgi:hypothetical protein
LAHDEAKIHATIPFPVVRLTVLELSQKAGLAPLKGLETKPTEKRGKVYKNPGNNRSNCGSLQEIHNTK